MARPLRHVLLLAAVATPGRLLATEHVPPPLVVGTPGGAVADALRDAFFAPFTRQSGIPVRDVTWAGRLAALENHARNGEAPEAPLVLMNDAAVLAACREGLLLPLDRSAMAAADTRTDAGSKPDAAGGPCGLPAFRTGLVLAWDRSRMDGVPGWSEFWDVARRPGKRGLARDPRGTLEIALLADGVAPGDVYRTLATSDGLDRAFRKLDQLRPYLVWWNTPAEAVQLIESGAVLMTSAPNDAVTLADKAGHRDFGIQWQNSLALLTSWAMPGRPDSAGAPAAALPPERSEAQQLLAFTRQPDRQAAFLSRFPAAPADPGAPVLAGAGDATLQHALHDALTQDDGFWATHLDAIQARFDAWIGAPGS